jgi:hypothetical protein
MIYPVVRELVDDGVPVATACRVLEVSTSGFYDWTSRGPSDRDLEQAQLMNLIHDAHAASYGTYGARRVHAELVLGQHLSGQPRPGGTPDAQHRACRACTAGGCAAAPAATRPPARPMIWSSGTSDRQRRTGSESPTSPVTGRRACVDPLAGTVVELGGHPRCPDGVVLLVHDPDPRRQLGVGCGAGSAGRLGADRREVAISAGRHVTSRSRNVRPQLDDVALGITDVQAHAGAPRAEQRPRAVHDVELPLTRPGHELVGGHLHVQRDMGDILAGGLAGNQIDQRCRRQPHRGERDLSRLPLLDTFWGEPQRAGPPGQTVGTSRQT